MIYSKPFPDGTIKTRGSGFGSVSWSRWGAGGERRGPGVWQGPHVPWGHPGDRQILNSAGDMGLSRAPTPAPGPVCAPGCSAPPFPRCRKCVRGRNASKQSRVFQRSSGPAWNRLSTGEALPSSRQRGREGGRDLAGPAVRAGDRRAARDAPVAGGALSPCGSLTPPLIWLFPTLSLYLSSIIRPVLRNPAAHLPPQRLRNALASQPRRGTKDKG